jgi:hypothetical protein
MKGAKTAAAETVQYDGCEGAISGSKSYKTANVNTLNPELFIYI